MGEITRFHNILRDYVNECFSEMENAIYYHGYDKETYKRRFYNNNINQIRQSVMGDVLHVMTREEHDYLVQRFGGYYRMIKKYINAVGSDVFKLPEIVISHTILRYAIDDAIENYGEELISYDRYNQWVHMFGSHKDEDEDDSNSDWSEKAEAEEEEEEEDEDDTKEEEERRIRWRNAPRDSTWVVWSSYISKDNLPEIPFNTTSVMFSELSKYNIIVELTEHVTEDRFHLYKVIRINKKTITVEECDQYGRRMTLYKSSLNIRDGPYRIVVV